MGMCKPSGGIIVIYGPAKHSLPGSKKEYANKRIDYYDENTKKILQQRWYNNEGLAERDRDWKHTNGDNSHEFPHDHQWDWKLNVPRLKAVPVNDDYC